MKNRIFGPFGLLALVTISALVVSIANAQDPAAGGGGRRGGGNAPAGGPGGPGGGPPGGRGNFGGGGGGITLDDKQRELIREARAKNTGQLGTLDEQLRAAQREFVKASIAEKYDEKVVREKADAVAKIQADIAMLNARAFSSVAPTLKPEQREQLETSGFGYMIVTGGGGRGGNAPADPNAAGGGRRRGGGAAPGQ